MLLTVNNDSTSRPGPDFVKRLNECDDVIKYEECGWFCVTGWRMVNGERRRHVHTHFNSREEFENLVNPSDDYKKGYWRYGQAHRKGR